MGQREVLTVHVFSVLSCFKVSQESVSSSRIWTKSDWLIQEPEVTKMRVREACSRGSRERAAITDNELSQVGFSFMTQNSRACLFFFKRRGKSLLVLL